MARPAWQIVLASAALCAAAACAPASRPPSGLVVVVEPAYLEGVIEVIEPPAGEPKVQVWTDTEVVDLLGPLAGELRDLGGERVALIGTLIDAPERSPALIVSKYRRGADARAV